jgi:hypothetical protein
MSKKPKNYLITASLLDAFDWMTSRDGRWRIEAEEEFADKLNRRKSDEVIPTIELGIKFEDTVRRCVKAGITDRGSEKFQEVCKKCLGGKPEQKVSATIDVDGIEYYLFGFVDYIMPKRVEVLSDHDQIVHERKIIDIKTTQRQPTRDKYLRRWQHHMYTLCTGIRQFTYLVVELNDAEEIVDLYEYTYNVQSWNIVNTRLIEQIRRLREWLAERPELDHAYQTVFTKSW